jgi:hypothetical protein
MGSYNGIGIVPGVQSFGRQKTISPNVTRLSDAIYQHPVSEYSVAALQQLNDSSHMKKRT